MTSIGMTYLFSKVPFCTLFGANTKFNCLLYTSDVEDVILIDNWVL